jgi:hypothetical protein
MFHVTCKGVLIGYSGSIEGARVIVRFEPPGCYEVDEIRADQSQFGITQRHWGILVAHSDGQVEVQPHQCP